MILRVTQDISRDLLASLNELRRQEQDAMLQVASGRRLSVPSDDPAAVAELVGNRSALRQAGQTLRNLATLRGTLQVADSALNSAVLALTRAISLGTQGGNSTLSAANRQALAEEVRGLREQLLTLTNVTFQGNYVFAGTAVTTPPYVADAASPSQVTYQGNDGVARLDLGEGQTLPMNLPGNRFFSDPAGDAFLALTRLVDALESGTGIETATGEVQTAFAHLNTQRAFYGIMLSRLDAASAFLDQESLQLSERENTLVAADLEVAALHLVQATNARNVAMSAAARISQLSLLDYLK